MMSNKIAFSFVHSAKILFSFFEELSQNETAKEKMEKRIQSCELFGRQDGAVEQIRFILSLMLFQ